MKLLKHPLSLFLYIWLLLGAIALGVENFFQSWQILLAIIFTFLMIAFIEFLGERVSHIRKHL